MDVVDTISNVKTTIRKRYRDVPMAPVEIIKVSSEIKEPRAQGTQ